MKPMTPKRPQKPDATAALLKLCEDILACEKALSASAARVRPRLSAGADPDQVRPALQEQAEGAQRLQTLVKALGEKLREARIDPGRREEVRRAVEAVKTRLASLAGEVESDYALTSRRGVRIPGVGGRPYPRKTTPQKHTEGHGKN
jgi:hypothetical protein